MKGAGGPSLRCLRHSLLFPPLLRRSLAIALVVGTVLVGINHGNRMVTHEVGLDMAWKVPLTYCVPFSVATVGALSNALRGTDSGGEGG